MSKITIEIDLEKLLTDKVDRSVEEILTKENHWYNLEDRLIRLLADDFMNKYGEDVLAKIDKDKLAQLVAERSTLEMAQAFVGRGRSG